MPVAVKKTETHSTLPRMEPYRVLNLVYQTAILLSIVFGGIGVWNGLSNKVEVLADRQARAYDDIKEVKTSLAAITQQLTAVQIGMANKQDKK